MNKLIKKYSLLGMLFTVAIMIVWVMCALIYCCFNDFPKSMPHGWNIILAIPCVGFLVSFIAFAASHHLIIITEIKDIIKNIN